MASRKSFTVEQATAHLSRLEHAEATSSNGGLRELFRGLQGLPPGVPSDRVEKACTFLIERLGVSYLSGASEHAWPALERALAARPKDPVAVFALHGLRSEQEPGRQLDRWLGFAGLPALYSSPKRASLEPLARDSQLINAAQAAAAVTPIEEMGLSRAVPLLAVEGSDESLDVLMPWLLRVTQQAGPELDRVRQRFVPLLPERAATQALLQRLEWVVEERTESSPAKAFCLAIGMNPPPRKLVFTASFFHTALAWQMKADSTKAAWFCIRRNEKWQWRSVDPRSPEVKQELGAGLTRVTMRASGKDVDRPALQAWLESFLSK